MPAELDRCVAHVMEKGHSESSAYAICRASTGLAENGSEDEKFPRVPDEEMKLLVANEMTRRDYASGPVLRKKMVLASAIGDFENGDQAGRLDVAALKSLVANHKKIPRQIPVYLITGTQNPDHPQDLDERLADGWVENFEVEGNDLVGDVKIHGEAARAVVSDQVRGASIGTIEGKTYQGQPIGQVLAHVVLTNSPFIKGMNIAASRAKGSEPVAWHFTALTTEADMADKDKKDAGAPGKDSQKPDDGSVNLTEKVTALECLLEEKEGIVRELTTANANLLEEIKAFRERPDLALAQKEIDQLKRHNLAEKVRRIAGKLMADRQINSEELRGWYDHDSDEVVLAGFKNSQFKGKMDLLEYHRSSVPKNPSRAFISGVQAGGQDGELTAEERQQAIDAGKDPDLYAKTRGARTFAEFKSRKAAALAQKKGA